MTPEQTIRHPFGITAFGSSILRMEPDIASLTFAVTRLAQHPKDAFQEARAGAESIRAFLARVGVDDIGSSRVTLSQTFRYTGGEQRFVGYTAETVFRVLLHDLSRMEEVLIGIVDAGANEVRAVELQTSRLKEIRAEARRRAVSAAREKAENYANAAGVTLGPVIHIEDVNPDRILSRQEGHVAREARSDDDQPAHAFDPGSVTIGGAVIVAFEIGR